MHRMIIILISLGLLLIMTSICINNVSSFIITVDDDRIQCQNANYTSIQAALDSDEISAGDDIEVYLGTYDNIVIDEGNPTDLRIYAHGYPDNMDDVTIDFRMINTDGITIQGTSNICIAGIHVQGDEDTGEGILIRDSHDIYILACEIEKTGKNGIYVAGTWMFNIIDCYIHANRQSGIRIVGGWVGDCRGTVSYTEVEENYRNGIAVISNDYSSAYYVLINNSKVHRNCEQGPGSYNGIYIENSNYVYIKNTIVTDNWDDDGGIFFWGPKGDSEVKYCNINTTNGEGEEAEDCKDDSMYGNTWQYNYYESNTGNNDPWAIPGAAGTQDDDPVFSAYTIYYQWRYVPNNGVHPPMPIFS